MRSSSGIELACRPTSRTYGGPAAPRGAAETLSTDGSPLSVAAFCRSTNSPLKPPSPTLGKTCCPGHGAATIATALSLSKAHLKLTSRRAVLTCPHENVFRAPHRPRQSTRDFCLCAQADTFTAGWRGLTEAATGFRTATRTSRAFLFKHHRNS